MTTGESDPTTYRVERIGLVGCVKMKRNHPTPGGDLYTSPLFVGRRRWVLQTCDRWFILSAKHGLVSPEQVLDPYDETLTNKSVADRRAWGQSVIANLRSQLGDLGDYLFEIHAGATYRDFGLRDGLVRAGAVVEIPAEGLAQGKQLALYRDGPPPRETTAM
jgi:hypothetical protein